MKLRAKGGAPDQALEAMAVVVVVAADIRLRVAAPRKSQGRGDPWFYFSPNQKNNISTGLIDTSSPSGRITTIALDWENRNTNPVKRAELGKRKTSHGEEEEEFSLNRNQKIGRHRRRLTVLRSSYFFVFFRASSVAPHISWLTSSNVRKVPKMATFFFFFFFFYDYRKDKKESADAADSPDTVLPITRPFCVSVCVPLGFLLLFVPFLGRSEKSTGGPLGGKCCQRFLFLFFVSLISNARHLSQLAFECCLSSDESVFHSWITFVRSFTKEKNSSLELSREREGEYVREQGGPLIAQSFPSGQ